MGSERVFAAWVPGLNGPDSPALYRAKGPGEAKWLCLLGAKDAGYDVLLTEVRVRRRPEFDAATFRNGVGPEYVAAPAPAKGEG